MKYATQVFSARLLKYYTAARSSITRPVSVSSVVVTDVLQAFRHAADEVLEDLRLVVRDVIQDAVDGSHALTE